MANLPDYVASAQPNPKENRTTWWKSTAQTYAGIMLWFVFWQEVTNAYTNPATNPGGLLSQGVWVAIGALVIAALIVWMVNWMYRISVESNREREVEEAARDYYDLHGRWPDE